MLCARFVSREKVRIRGVNGDVASARVNEHGTTENVHEEGSVDVRTLKARIGKKTVTTGLGLLGSVVVD